MNILLSLRQPLVPADTGGKVRSLNILRRLAKRTTVHAVSFADRITDREGIAEMKNLFASYTPVYWHEKQKYSAAFYAEVITSQFSSWPYFLSKCNQPELCDTVRSMVKRNRFDLLFCDFLHTAAPLQTLATKPKIVFEHNVEFLLRKRKWQVETNVLRKQVFKSEWQKTHAIEGSVCRRFDHVLAVSEDDKKSLQCEFGIKHVSVLPTGVDTDYFKPADQPTIPGRLVFVGSMDWDPNEDGVIWFLRMVYPRIRQVNPGVSLTVVGRAPSPRLRAAAAAEANVEVTGTVPDVRPYLAQAEVVVVPLRVGGGTRIKIPEAMAMGKVVLSTTIGAEGLPFQVGREICIADDPDDFAETAITLLRDHALRIAISGAARKKVEEKHGWDVVVDRLQQVLDNVVAQSRPTRSQTSVNQVAEVRA